jgi:hypothetical protein
MSVKEIKLKVIDSKIANDFVKKHHYSWKIVNNSNLHFWVFYKGQLGGVMSYWPSVDKSKLIWLVEWTQWNEFIELNRMAFSDFLPRNSESRAIAISILLIKRQAPHIKRIISFADGCQCWDWTIYRASWFELTAINKKDNDFWILPWGESFAILTLKLKGYWGYIKKYISEKEFYKKTGSRFRTPSVLKKLLLELWAKPLTGFSLRYIKLLKQNLKRNYEILAYEKIKEMWAKMYLWEKQK